MKMNKFLPLGLFAALFLTTGCHDDDGFAGMTDTTPPTQDEVVLTAANVRSYMADPNATDETVALFYNLKQLQKTRYLVGQQDAFAGFYNDAGGDSDIKKATGSDPALLGSDFMFITDNQNTGEDSNWYHQQEILITTNAKNAYNKGMVNAFCWHFREPFEGLEFYTDNMTADEKQNALASILPGGVNHDYYKTKLDKVADVLNNLKGADDKLIPVIFRPFHEFDGSWFWWGSSYCTPDQYKQLWQFTVGYLRDTKSVHNVLYAFSPDNSYATETDYLSRYPGDGYVDVLGMDNYGDFSSGSATGVTTANNKLQMVSGIAKTKVKIAAMTETGYQVTATTPPLTGFFNTNIYTAMTANNVELAFVMFWNNSTNGYYVPPSGASNVQDFKDFAAKPESVLLSTIPNMYAMPAE